MKPQSLRVGLYVIWSLLSRFLNLSALIAAPKWIGDVGNDGPSLKKEWNIKICTIFVHNRPTVKLYISCQTKPSNKRAGRTADIWCLVQSQLIYTLWNVVYMHCFFISIQFDISWVHLLLYINTIWYIMSPSTSLYPDNLIYSRLSLLWYCWDMNKTSI